MLILACDTSTDYAVFALGTDSGELIESVSFKHQRDLSQRFYESLDCLLSKANKKFKDIDILAVGVGPGSFTGVRIAVTTMKTLAQAASKKLVSVGTTTTYARASVVNSTERLAVVLPSRKGEVYYQFFVGSVELGDPNIASYEIFEELLKDTRGSTTLCGQTAILPAQFNRFQKIEQFGPPASSFIELAAEKARRAEYVDPITLKPVYAALPAISQHKSRC